MYTCKNPRAVIPYGLLNSKHIRRCHTRRFFIIGISQEIAKQEEEADSIEQFIRRAKKYPELTELTPAVLHDLVNKVYVCAPDNSSGHRVQDVQISLACIGFLPESIITEMVNHAVKSRTA